jgi:hypothetical protein
MVAAIAVLFLVTAGFVVSRVMHIERSGVGSRPGESPVAAAQQPMSPAQTQPAQASAPYPSTSPQPPAQQAAVPGGNTPAAHPSGGSIDLQEVQRALNTMAQRGERGAPSPPSNSTASSADSGSDRYPNSQPVEVKDVSLPDIGVPVASEVYTTTDSIATVVDYYRQRYPEAVVTEVNGQKIVAVDQPGATKVIAIGTAGTETRIAIVRPAD